jgi:hypothetical protein
MASLVIWNWVWPDGFVISADSQTQFPFSLPGTVVLLSFLIKENG